MDDMSLKELKKFPTATSTTYTSTSRSDRRTTKKISINITVEQMNEIRFTLKRLEDQTIKSLTSKRAISEHEKVISSQNNLNLPPEAFLPLMP